MLTAVGVKNFYTMDSQMLLAMNRLMPEPRPYPFWRRSSMSMAIRAATLSWTMRSRQTPAPSSLD